MTEKKAYDKILEAINRELEKHKILVKKGAIIDASITPTPRKPKGKKIYEAEENRAELKEVVKRG